MSVHMVTVVTVVPNLTILTVHFPVNLHITDLQMNTFVMPYMKKEHILG